MRTRLCNKRDTNPSKHYSPLFNGFQYHSRQLFMTGAKNMQYVELGTSVIYKQEKAEVIEQYQQDKKTYVVLDTSEGRRSVPATKISWTGSAHAVTPEDREMAQALYAVEYAIDSIREKLNQWAQEYPSADPRSRKLTVKHCAFAAIETATAATGNNDKQLGFIVRGIVDRLEDI